MGLNLKDILKHINFSALGSYFDLSALVSELKDKGLVAAENDAQMLTQVIGDWLEVSFKKVPLVGGVVADMLDEAQKKALEELDKLDGQPGV